MRNGAKAGRWTQQSRVEVTWATSIQDSWRDYYDYYELLMRRRRSPAWPAVAEKWTKQKTVIKLTSTPLLSVSAASSYSGFIFLQCPHPKRFISVITPRTGTQIINQRQYFGKTHLKQGNNRQWNSDWLTVVVHEPLLSGVFSRFIFKYKVSSDLLVNLIYSIFKKIRRAMTVFTYKVQQGRSNSLLRQKITIVRCKKKKEKHFKSLI